MRYFKEIENNIIVMVGDGFNGIEISKEEYDNIINIINHKPIAPTGYDYLLKDDLTWELIEIPQIDEEEEE